jgi:superfamily II DNA or RNA helicase
MALKDIKLNIRKGKNPTDPIEIFRGLTLRGSVENIWGPQQEALEQWHTKYRKEKDNVIQMNTGGGKTLVGLLIAQSLLNDTSGRVLYLCVNNQLVEQTIEKATECGFMVSSRYGGKWVEQHKFETCQAFCITNYDTVFNGLSIFREKQIEALGYL